MYAVPTLHFVKEALPLQGEQDGSLVREKKVLPDLVCRLIMQQLRFACHPAPPLSLKLCGETGELVAVFPEAVSCLTETQFLLLGTLASLTVMACFPEREMLRRSFNFVEDRLRWISTSTKMIASVDGDFNMW